MRRNPPNELEEIDIPVERTLKASSQSDIASIYDVLKANVGRIVDLWAASTAKSSYLRGVDFNVSEEVRVDRMRAFLGAVIQRAENPEDKKSNEVLKSAIRADHYGSTTFTALVKKQNLLRDAMLYVVEHDLPNLSKATAKLALDAMIDRTIEATIQLMEQYAEIRSSLATCMPGSPDPKFSFDQALVRFCTSVLDYFDVEFAGLFKYNRETKDLICQACSSKSISLAKDSSFQVDMLPIAAEAISTKRIASATDLAFAAKKKPGARIEFPNMVATPLLREHEVDAVFVIGDSSRIVPVTPAEISLIEDIAVQIAWVMQTVAMLQQMNVRSRAQKVLIETAAALQQEIESSEIYRIVTTRLGELVPCNESALYLFDWSKRTCSPVFATGPYVAEIMADRDFPADVGFVGYVGKTRKPEIVMDTESDPRGEYIPGTPQTHTRMLAVPIIGKKETIGVIELLRYPPQSFSQEDSEIALMFANHASVALENAKLLKEIIGARDEVQMHMDLLTHDIANYATPIMAYFESLKTKKDLDKDVASVLEKAARQAENMMRLIDMVRVMAMLRDNPPKKLRSMDLRKAINSAVAKIKDRTQTKDLTFDINLPPEEVMMVRADDLLTGIFTDLFYSLALTEKKEQSTLSITAESKRDRKMDYWWVKVSSPTHAIPAHLKGDILRMPKSSKSELSGGLGIGVAAARSIVEHYQGNMWVSDIVLGDYTKGCVFNFMLPRAK